MDWDQQSVVSSTINTTGIQQSRESRYGIQNQLREFIRHYREGQVFIYRDQLLANYRKQKRFLEVELGHVNAYDPRLQTFLVDNPSQYLPLFERAAKEALKQLIVKRYEDEETLDNSLDDTDRQSMRNEMDRLEDIQIILKSDQAPVALRQVHAQEINKLMKIPGIIISASRIRAKCVSITVQCRKCSNIKVIACASAFGGASIPRKCDRTVELNEEPCPPDSYMILPDKCRYIDQQTLKLQEAPEVVPTGEMPRNVLLSTDRFLVDKTSPGTRVSILGISSVFNSGTKRQVGAVAVRTPYLRVVGMEVDEDGAGRSKCVFTPAEEEMFHQMARDPAIYSKLSVSIAPSIYGEYTTDIKKAIACQLIGGSRKQLPDGMMLRGDINVLLLGDPSTAKSQFLKFAEKVAPVGVYTSGKGSSAAGLTASVIKDSKGEFFLEGGAMVLADGGVVCIDEFDKMRESDRVAIHEAMEQQTISIAKAGITTILNSRASVLAAANPVYGRYDDMKSATQNIDMMSTILSRFDLIFIVRDIQDDARDQMIAAHVVRVHTNSLHSSKNATEAEAAKALGEIDVKLMKKYITYCRSRCAPRLGAQAAKALQDFYVNVRDDVRKSSLGENRQTDAIPVTVRQLEALVRISESLAKMTLSVEATAEHVEEAIRLFRVSTMNASREGGTGNGLYEGFHKDVESVEERITRSLRVNHRVLTSAFYSKLEQEGFNPNAIQKAIRAMIQKGVLRQMSQYKFIQRLK